MLVAFVSGRMAPGAAGRRHGPRGGLGQALHATISRVDLELLDETLAAAGEPVFRARQVWRWTASGAHGYDEMTDLPAALRAHLDDAVPFSSLRLIQEAHASDGTVKALFHTRDGRPVEAVLMRYRDGRRSICVSSQSGCPLTCTFCATGSMKFGRNLTASEILDQVLHFRRIEPVDHLVFMGMGEPMMNLEHVLAAAGRLPDVGITHRRTTVSTVGWVPGIDRLTESNMPIRLAFSLHAADEALRSRIMPVNDRYPLADVLAACERYHARRRRKVFIEYVMLAGVNDSYAQAVQLAQLLDPKVFKVNLIPFNPTDASYRGSSREAIAAFKAALEEHGMHATIRLTRGRDIDAACGQLAARSSPARSRRSRSAVSSSGLGSHAEGSGRSSIERSPNSFRNRGVVR
jgi:23S rRNA (adenine2503-C2)-methyltransferase